MLQVIMLVVGVWYLYELFTLGGSGSKLGLPPEVLVEWRAQRRKQYLWGIAAGWGSLVAGILTSVAMTPSYPTTTDVARAQLTMIVVTAIVLVGCLVLSIAASRKAKSFEEQRTAFGRGMLGYPPTAGQPGGYPAPAQSAWYPPAAQAPAPAQPAWYPPAAQAPAPAQPAWYPPAAQAPAPATPIPEPVAPAGPAPTAGPASPSPAPDHNRIRLGTFVAAGSSVVLLAVLFIPWFTWIEGSIVITPYKWNAVQSVGRLVRYGGAGLSLFAAGSRVTGGARRSRRKAYPGVQASGGHGYRPVRFRCAGCGVGGRGSRRALASSARQRVR